MTDKRYLIIYHKEDNDGHFSAAIFYNYLTEKLGVKPVYISTLGCNHEDMNRIYSQKNADNKTGLDIIIEEYDIVIMTDISFNDAKMMKKLYDAKKKNFIWVDHHKPIIEESFKLKFDDAPGIRDINRSAILNAYKFLFDQFDENYNDRNYKMELFRIMSGFDSFTHEQEGFTKEYVFAVNQGVTNTFLLDFKEIIEFVRSILFDDYTEEDIHQRINEFKRTGDMHVRVEDNRMKTLMKEFSVEYKFDGGKRTAIALFYPGQSYVSMFKSVADKYEHGVCFKQMSSGKWGISLYNTDENNEFHCGEYLKKHYGGGGHQGAAGCQITEEEMLEIIKNKTF